MSQGPENYITTFDHWIQGLMATLEFGLYHKDTSCYVSELAFTNQAVWQLGP